MLASTLRPAAAADGRTATGNVLRCAISAILIGRGALLPSVSSFLIGADDQRPWAWKKLRNSGKLQISILPASIVEVTSNKNTKPQGNV